MDYIPIIDDEYILAFCQATNALPNDIQRIIWKNLMIDDDLEPPPTPKKTYERKNIPDPACVKNLSVCFVSFD